MASERFGKSSGVRVIYYLIREDRIYILHAYAKGELEDLTQSQLKELRSLLDE